MESGLYNKKGKKVQLTTELKINDGSHILYFYDSDEGYIKNAVSFILTAHELNHKVVFIESNTYFESIVEELTHYISKAEIDTIVQYVNNYEFYEMYQDFHFERVLNNFNDVIKKYVENNEIIRVWGHVDWSKQENIDEKLCAYESEADLSINEIGYITVCSYNGMEVPASIQTKLLKSHEYLMTDDQIVSSNFYKKTEEVVFPSLSSEKEIKTELDFYKKKLDFIHVVSHEVRNPLTVIKAFSTLLKEKSHDEVDNKYLQLISDYADAIDYEINHIIQTEQMLTTEALWKVKLIKISPIIQEVVGIMDIKARTQNIYLDFNINIDQHLILKGNSTGMRLVFSNLISNAIKYSEEGKEVTINVYTENQFLFFEVVDYGIGMSKEQLKKLFQKYEKMNDDKSGQGIGLFMVKKLTDLFKGTIYVKSEPGKGSKFLIKLPL